MEYENEHDYEKALIFLDRKIMVHVSKKDGTFYNGLLLEVGNSFFIIKDRFDGYEHYVMFSELKRPLEPFREANNEM